MANNNADFGILIQKVDVWSDRDQGNYRITIDFSLFTKEILDKGIDALLRNPTTRELLTDLQLAYIIPPGRTKAWKITTLWHDTQTNKKASLETEPRDFDELERAFPTFSLENYEYPNQTIFPNGLEDQEKIALIKMTMKDMWGLALKWKGMNK